MSIIKGSLIVILGTFGIKVALLFKDVLISRQFGISSELSLYLSVFLIPSILSNQLGITLQVLNTPRILKDASRLNSSLLKRTIIQQCFFTSSLFVVLFFSVETIFPQKNLNELSNLYLLLFLIIPYFLLMPIRTLFGQILYLNQKHTSNFLLGFISPFFIIIYLLLKPNPSALDLGISLAISSIIEYSATYLYLDLKNLIDKKKSVLSSLNLFELFPPLVLQIFIGSNLLVDQIFAFRAGEEFLAVFNYSSKIPNIIGSVSMILSSSIFLPYFQTMRLKNKSFKAQGQKVFLGTLLIAFVTLLAYLFSYDLTKIIYQRGNFAETATMLVSNIQALYFLTAPLTAIFLVFIRYLNAMNRNREALLYGFISFISVWISNTIFFNLQTYHFIPFSVITGYCIISLIHYFKMRKYEDPPIDP